jgi:hypothetical protein
MSATIDDAKQLLEKVAEMRSESLENARETGASFNIFSILGVEHYETSTHSAFLAELLNPKGSHGQEDLFLRLFIRQLRQEEFKDFNTQTAEIRKEFYIRPIYAESDPGRLDILLRDSSGRAIGIENKIYARDQENQLGKYASYLKREHGENSLLLYLTLDGQEASEVSTGNGDFVYRRISYSEDIRDWLKRCQEEVPNTPSLKEAIGQYIELIKKLTNQSMDKEMKTEMIKWIKEHNKIEEVLEICALKYDLFTALHQDIVHKLKGTLTSELERKGYQWKIFPTLHDYPRSGDDLGITIRRDGWNYTVCVYFQEVEGKNIQIGVHSRDHAMIDSDSKGRLNTVLKEFGGFEFIDHCITGTGTWIWVAVVPEWREIPISDWSSKGVEVISSAVNMVLDACEKAPLIRKEEGAV